MATPLFRRRERLNPFGTGQCLTTYPDSYIYENIAESQSLWNRAMSYDNCCFTYVDTVSLNPFGTGQCLTTYYISYNIYFCCWSQSLWNRAMSYDMKFCQMLKEVISLNPFGTGQCLTTAQVTRKAFSEWCLNPFGTGQCLTTIAFWHCIRIKR